VSTAKFRARITVEDEDTQEVEVWDDELTPFDGKRCSIREWVKPHLDDYSNEDLRELLNLPTTGNYEAVIEGRITGVQTYGPDGDDYDEYIDILKIESQQIPDSYYEGGDTVIPLDAPSEG
jgi:hypothetical protein